MGIKRALEFSSGKEFDATFDAVLGSEVAKTLDYSLDTKIIPAHGAASTSFSLHENKPFSVVEYCPQQEPWSIRRFMFS